MNIFEKTFEKILTEDITAATAFGTVDAGATGNQFPSQNSKGFAPNDNRPIDPNKIILGKKKKKKKMPTPIQRRNFVYF
jgi:hypothetical protein